jgi:hypothetical protein
MNVNESGHFDPECLAKWLKVSREYLLAPPEESRCVATGEGPLRRQAAQDPGGRSRLLSWAQRALSHLLRRASRGEENPLKALESGLYFHVSLMAKYPSLPATILGWYLQTTDARVRARIGGVIGHYETRLSRLIARAKQQGLVKQGIDARAAAAVLVGLIQGLALRMNAGISRPETLMLEATSVFPAYLDGIRASPAQFST